MGLCTINLTTERSSSLIKLNAIGVTGSLQKWLRGFLINRLQRVVINGCYSEWLQLSQGYPRAQSLDSYCRFLLYINDLQEAVSYSELNVFVDDVALYKEIKSSVLTVIFYKKI